MERERELRGGGAVHQMQNRGGITAGHDQRAMHHHQTHSLRHGDANGVFAAEAAPVQIYTHE